MKTGASVARSRAIVLGEILVAAAITAAIWFALDRGLPPLTGMADPLARVVFAFKCCCLAILFCFVTGVEAVAHERLGSPAIDPLSGFETARMRINLRYLQHTLEQLVVFVPALIGLAWYSDGGRGMRAVVATAVVWVLARFAFWIGYHRGSLHRAAGAPGMVLAMLVLLYVCARFGFEIAGTFGAVAIVGAFAAAEAVLVVLTRPLKN